MKSNTLSAKQFILIIVIVFLSITANAQDRHLDSLYTYQPALTSSDDVTSLTGEGSFVHNSNKTGIIDEILLYPGWQNGVVNFSNGKQLKDVELKFNLLKNELYFNNNNKLNYFANEVKSFSMFDTTNQQLKVATFSNGYPHLGQQTDKTYYLVLTVGPHAQLLKLISKRKQDIYEYSAPAKTVYNFTEQLLVYDVKSSSLKTIKNSIASVEKALPEYTNIIQQSLADKSAKSLSDEDILGVIRSVNNAQ